MYHENSVEYCQRNAISSFLSLRLLKASSGVRYSVSSLYNFISLLPVLPLFLLHCLPTKSLAHTMTSSLSLLLHTHYPNLRSDLRNTTKKPARNSRLSWFLIFFHEKSQTKPILSGERRCTALLGFVACGLPFARRPCSMVR